MVRLFKRWLTLPVVKTIYQNNDGKKEGNVLFNDTLNIDRITHTTAFVTPVVEHWLEQEIAQWIHHEGSI